MVSTPFKLSSSQVTGALLMLSEAKVEAIT